MRVDLESLPGYHWQENGQSVLGGRPLGLARRLDRLFLRWAAEVGADEYRFPTFIAARELHKLDYFRSFPHLVTFPAVLDGDPERLARFAEGPKLDEGGNLRLGPLAPVRDVLTPAACYHVYVLLQGQRLARPRTFTTVATCFRREAYYSPLRRQWSFTMREIVGIGTADEVRGFLASFRDRLVAFFSRIDLPIEWKQATDPFFDPSRDPRFLAQRLDPVKTEMVFGGDLAIGSVNFHRNLFGETFGILRGDEPAFSGCVAFGIERWLYAFLERFGDEENGWPAEIGAV